jgi:tetratricopeptide (TPR) repeat protein
MADRSLDADLPLQIFISYAHRDRSFVDRLARDLQQNRIRYWIDQHEILGGESVVEAIENAIRTSDVLLVALSYNSLNSRWVREELEMMLLRATNEGAILLPIRLDHCEVPLRLQARRYIDFSQGYEAGLSDLMASLAEWHQRKGKTLFLAKMDEMTTSTPRNDLSRALTELGKLAISAHAFDQAEAILIRAIELLPRNWDAHHLLAAALIRTGQFDRAEKMLSHLGSTKGQTRRANYNLACLYSRHAEAVGITDPRWREDLLSRSYQHLKRALVAGFLYWLRVRAGRDHPLRDVETDPDLLYAIHCFSPMRDFLEAYRKTEPVVPAMSVTERGKDSTPIIAGGGGGCMAEDTQILLGDGSSVPVGQLRCGDRLVSHGGSGTRGQSRIWRTMRLWEDNGVTINGTLTVSRSQLLLAVHGWTTAGALRAGDVLVGTGGVHRPIEAVEPWNGQRVVHHFNLNGLPTFLAEGYVLHNSKAMIGAGN